MHLIQLFLPLHDNAANAFPTELFRRVQQELTERFGGLTGFTRAPVEGLWTQDVEVKKDDLVIYEVMTNDLDRSWWRSYRLDLEARFRQEHLIVRAQEAELL